MTTALVDRSRRLVATALARAGSFLLEPVERVERPVAISVRPVVAVVGLAPRCGTTTVARALAVELGLCDVAGAAAVAGRAPSGKLLIGSAPAARLARAIGAPGGHPARPSGRLCLFPEGDEARLADAVRHLAPLVIDVGHGQPPGVAASLADHVLLLASTAVEPALTKVVAASLARVGPPPIVALNRGAPGVPDPDGWAGPAEAVVERSPVGARLALAGRDPRGVLGPGLAELAEACEAVRSEW